MKTNTAPKTAPQKLTQAQYEAAVINILDGVEVKDRTVYARVISNIDQRTKTLSPAGKINFQSNPKVLEANEAALAKVPGKIKEAMTTNRDIVLKLLNAQTPEERPSMEDYRKVAIVHERPDTDKGNFGGLVREAYEFATEAKDQEMVEAAAAAVKRGKQQFLDLQQRVHVPLAIAEAFTARANDQKISPEQKELLRGKLMDEYILNRNGSLSDTTVAVLKNLSDYAGNRIATAQAAKKAKKSEGQLAPNVYADLKGQVDTVKSAFAANEKEIAHFRAHGSPRIPKETEAPKAPEADAPEKAPEEEPDLS